MTLHVLAALLWVGGVLFLALVGLPMARGNTGEEPQQELAFLLIRISLVLGAVCATALLMSGIANLAHRSPVSAGLLSIRGWQELLTLPLGPLYAGLLAIKLSGFVGLLSLSALLWKKVQPLHLPQAVPSPHEGGLANPTFGDAIIRFSSRLVGIQGAIGLAIVLISLLLQRIHPIVGS